MATDPVQSWESYVRDLGFELNRRRHEAGLSQERLAHAAGITRYHYQQLEKGESRPGTPANPSLRIVMALAEALGVDLVDLLPADVPRLSAAV